MSAAVRAPVTRLSRTGPSPAPWSPFQILLAALERHLARACPGEEPRLLRGGPPAASSNSAALLAGRHQWSQS